MSDVMVIKDSDSHQYAAINDFFIKNCYTFTPGNLQHPIMQCIRQFRKELFDDGFISYENDINAEKITCTDKLSFEPKHYLQYPNYLARFVCRFFSTTHIFVTNRNSSDGVIFIGEQNNLYATQLIFEWLKNIATPLYDTYIKKLNRYKKQETKEDKARHYIKNWLDELSAFYLYKTWFDLETALFRSYIKKHFKTIEDERIALFNMKKLLQPVVRSMKTDQINLVEFAEKTYGFYPKDQVIKIMTEFDKLSEMDLVLFFGDDDDEDWGA